MQHVDQSSSHSPVLCHLPASERSARRRIIQVKCRYLAGTAAAFRIDPVRLMFYNGTLRLFLCFLGFSEHSQRKLNVSCW